MAHGAWEARPGSPEVLALARSGDEAAFGRLVDPFRRELHVHCYRILGSVQDADDVAWRPDRRFKLVASGANGQPAYGCYLPQVGGRAHTAGVVVLTITGEQISAITRFLDEAVVTSFGLPLERPDGTAGSARG